MSVKTSKFVGYNQNNILEGGKFMRLTTLDKEKFYINDLRFHLKMFLKKKKWNIKWAKKGYNIDQGVEVNETENVKSNRNRTETFSGNQN